MPHCRFRLPKNRRNRAAIRLALRAVFAVAVSAAAQAAPPDPRTTFRNVERITTPDGIRKDGFVRIGGIPQFVSVRSRHKANPVLLFVHGGPGLTSIPASYFYMQGWDEYFTLVQWDQRGSGKTFEANPGPQHLSIARMEADTEELVQYLRITYAKPKIVVLGQSWGSVPGLMLAERHPDWLYAYVGMGQVVDFPQSEKLGYEMTLAAARAAHDDEAVASLEALAPFPEAGQSHAKLMSERRWLSKYGGVFWPTGNGNEDDVVRMSPDYSAHDLAVRDSANAASVAALWPELAHVSFRTMTDFRCPIVIFEGRHDLSTSATVVGEWFPRIHAPKKKLVWFEDSSHLVYEEEPGKTLVSLVNDVLPLTRESP
jgi:proline iminopeptidase